MFVAGCGEGGPTVAIVSGEVKVDGRSLEKGTISFTPVEGTGNPATGEIVQGRYEVRTTSGKMRVMISAPVVVDKKKDSTAPDANWIEITHESLPDKYHSKSTIHFDIQPGSQAKDWEAESIKKQRSEPALMTEGFRMGRDLAGMIREQRINEVQRLRDGIRGTKTPPNTNSVGTSRTYLRYAEEDLWAQLQEDTAPQPTVRGWLRFLRGCIWYRQSLDVQEPTRLGSRTRSRREHFRTSARCYSTGVTGTFGSTQSDELWKIDLGLQ